MPRWLDGREAELLELVREHGPNIELLAAKIGAPTYGALEIAKRRTPALREAWGAAAAEWKARTVKAEAPRDDAEPPAPASSEGTAVESPVLGRVLTLEELLTVAQVDRTEWEVERHVINKWEVGAKHPVTGDVIVEPLFQVKAWLSRIPGANLAKLKAELLADIAADAERRAGQPMRHAEELSACFGRVPGRHALEVCLMDLHVGKLAWADETRTDYDSRIAEQLARAAVTDLLHQASIYELEEIILPLGNDFFHYDTTAGHTTSGTPQDRDTRLHLMFRRGRGIASWMIEECAKMAPVRVVIVPGNHDELLAFMLGEVLEAEFKHDARVSVDNSPRLRKYVAYGANLIGYTHGKDEQHAKLPTIMATEEPGLWGASRYREWHLGHLHHSRRTDATPVNSHNGVRVRILQSLSGTDAWHARKGYVGEPQAAEGFVWRHEGGLRANLFTMPALLEEPARRAA